MITVTDPAKLISRIFLTQYPWGYLVRIDTKDKWHAFQENDTSCRIFPRSVMEEEEETFEQYAERMQGEAKVNWELPHHTWCRYRSYSFIEKNQIQIALIDQTVKAIGKCVETYHNL